MHHGVAEVNIDTRVPSEASYNVHVVGPDRTSEIVEIQQVTLTRYSGTFQMQDSGSYIVTAEREGDTRRSIETVSLPYPAEYAEFQVDTTSLKMLITATAGIHEPTSTQIAAPAGEAIERQASLAQVLLVVAAILFVLEMILRRFSITNRYLAAFLARFRWKSVGSPAEAQVINTPLENPMPSDGRTTEDTVSSQSTETSMTRLLAAKRRAR